jgi:putative tributyrin esterase
MIIEEIAQMKKGENNFIANYDYFSEVFGQLDTLESSENNPVNVIQNLKTSNKHMPHLYVAMGTEDPILESLKPFIDFLNTNNIDHVYVEDRGVHDWEFWKRHIVLGVEDLLKNL